MAPSGCSGPGLRILSATDTSATLCVSGTEGLASGACAEVRKGNALLGFLQVSTVEGGKAECKLIAGRADVQATAIPIVPATGKIVLLVDEPKSKAAVELGTLYPGLLVTDPGKWGECRALVWVTSGPAKASDFTAVERFAASGGTAIVSVEAYAIARGAKVVAVKQKAPPQIRIERVTDLTRGMSIGQAVNWYGTEGEEKEEQKKDKFHATLSGLPESPDVAVIATSAANGNPIFVEEKIGKGRIVAMDLASPNGRAGYDAGSKNKWVFAGNLLGNTVRHARYRTEKLSYDDFVSLEKAIVVKHKDRAALAEEGKGSDGDPTYSLLIGNPSAPRFLIIGAIHGGEWKNSYAMLDIIETLLSNPDHDYKMDWLLRTFGIKLIPILNVAGYKKYGQVNKNDCDLNRNYPFHWESFKGDGGWRAKYPAEVLRGKAPFSEAESRIVKRIVEAEKPIGLVDFHMHGFESGHMICCPHKDACADLGELKAVQLLVNERLRNRYLFGSDKALQLTGGGYGSDRPFLINWAGTLGVRSTVFESAGGFEDSLPHGDVVIEDCLNFLYVIGANFQARSGR